MPSELARFQVAVERWRGHNLLPVLPLASIPSPSNGVVDIGPLHIHMYGLMLLLAIAACILLTGYSAATGTSSCASPCGASPSGSSVRASITT